MRTLTSAEMTLEAGVYRLNFDVRSYFATHQVAPFYPEISILFFVRDAREHYHVPLLLNPYGYTTYRGS